MNKEKTSLNSALFNRKIGIMTHIATCLPSTKYDLYERLKGDADEEGWIKSRTTLDKYLDEMMNVGLIREGNCPICHHGVLEVSPLQTSPKFEGENNSSDTVFLFTDNKLDKALFLHVLLDKLSKQEYWVKVRNRGTKSKIVKKNLTVTHHRSHPC